MVTIQHPWQTGPTELIEFALERMQKGGDVDRRIAFLILDVAVETLFKTYLTLPESAMEFQIKREDRIKGSKGNFPELLQAVRSSNPERALNFNFSHIEHYHAFRNTLYHQGNQVTAVPIAQLEGYARLAVDLLDDYLDVDLSEEKTSPAPAAESADDPVVDFAEVEVSFGRFRVQRLSSQSISVLSLDTNMLVVPVKPFLRTVIKEKSLPIDLNLKTGKGKNTRTLGKEVIQTLKFKL